MSRFSNTLTDCIALRGWNESQLASLCGIPQSKINRWATGKTAPKADSLLVVLSKFDESQQAKLIRSYLLDELPDAFAHLVNISLADPCIFAEQPTEYLAKPKPPEGLSNELLGQIYRVAELARDVPEIAAIFAEFDRLIQRRAFKS